MKKPKKINSRRKGHQFERDIANEFKSIGWDRAQRNLEYQVSNAIDGVDIINTYPFLPQCKAHNDYVSVSTINQVKDKPGEYPILITKGNNKEPMVVMRWEHFKDLLTILKRENIFW